MNRLHLLLVLLFLTVLLLSCTHDDTRTNNPEIDGLLSLAENIQYTQSDTALQITREALETSLKHDYTAGIAKASHLMGGLLYQMGGLSQSIEHLGKALRIYEHQNNLNQLAHVNLNLAKVYQRLNNQNQSFLYLHKARQLFKQTDDQLGMSMVFSNLGHFYEKKQLYDSALSHQLRALEILQQIDNATGLAEIHDNIGSIYEDLNRFVEAKEQFELALRINQKNKNFSAAIVNLNNIGDTYRKRALYNEALTYSLQALELAENAHLNYQIKSACRDLSKVYQAMGDLDKALAYLERSYEITDDIFSQKLASEIANTQSVYELESKQQRITILENERIFNRYLTIISSSGIIVFFILGGLVFYQQKSKNIKKRKLLEAEASLTRTQLENTQLSEQALKTELENTALKEAQLRQELELKSKSLTKSALHMIQKNEFLQDIRKRLKDVRKGEPELQDKRIKKLIKSIELNFNMDDDWQEFETVFQQVHSEFFEKLKMLYPNLSPAEVRLCAMLRLNLHSKDMAAIMGISQDSLRIARYRLRKRLGLDKGSNLYTFILNIA